MAGKGKSKKKAKKAAHNTRIDMGRVGQGAPEDEMAMVPPKEMHSAQKAPHKMAQHEMYAPADPTHHLHATVEEHAKAAAKYAGMGAQHRELADHHRQMADALRTHMKHGQERSDRPVGYAKFDSSSY